MVIQEDIGYAISDQERSKALNLIRNSNYYVVVTDKGSVISGVSHAPNKLAAMRELQSVVRDAMTSAGNAFWELQQAIRGLSK